MGLFVTNVIETKCYDGRDWITVLEKVANSEIPAILKTSDVFVRAVEEEGFGISRIEALWAGTPVVATRVGATRGMLLYDFGDVEQLVSHLRSLLFSPRPIESNPWPAHYRNEAEENLRTLAKVLGIQTLDAEKSLDHLFRWRRLVVSPSAFEKAPDAAVRARGQQSDFR